jgi:hypothetical protein
MTKPDTIVVQIKAQQLRAKTAKPSFGHQSSTYPSDDFASSITGVDLLLHLVGRNYLSTQEEK